MRRKHFQRILQFDLIQNMMRLKATPEDVKRYKKAKKDIFQRLKEKDIQILQLTEKFYSLAEKREKYLVRNTLKRVNSDTSAVKGAQKNAVLVVGGYHTPGVTKALRKKGVSYDVITPRLTKLPTENIYEKIMASYDQYFGVQEGTRGGTVQVFNAITELVETHANQGEVEKLRAEILPTLVTALMARPDKERLIQEWNRLTNECAIVDTDGTGKKVFFVKTEEAEDLLDMLRNHETRFEELEAMVVDGTIGRMVSGKRACEDVYQKGRDVVEVPLYYQDIDQQKYMEYAEDFVRYLKETKDPRTWTLFDNRGISFEFDEVSYVNDLSLMSAEDLKKEFADLYSIRRVIDVEQDLSVFDEMDVVDFYGRAIEGFFQHEAGTCCVGVFA